MLGLHLMTQMSNRYEKMGPICTRRLFIRDPTHANGDGQPQPTNPERIQNHNDSPYYSRGESSDYAFALLFGMAGIILSHFFILPYLPSSLSSRQHHNFFHRHLTFFVVYIWSKHHPHHSVNLFGFRMSAAYLPYAYFAMGYVLNNGQAIPVDILHGMFVGHVYYYLSCVVPTVLGGGNVAIVTPIILVDLCNWLEGRGQLGGGGEGGDEDNPMLVDVDGVIGG